MKLWNLRSLTLKFQLIFVNSLYVWTYQYWLKQTISISNLHCWRLFTIRFVMHQKFSTSIQSQWTSFQHSQSININCLRSTSIEYSYIFDLLCSTSSNSTTNTEKIESTLLFIHRQSLGSHFSIFYVFFIERDSLTLEFKNRNFLTVREEL